MARYNDAVCRLCRREGMKLYLKGERCFKEKCSFETRKGKIPGQHGAAKAKKPTGYALQLREKQKVKRIYGVLEKQFSLYFKQRRRQEGRDRPQPAGLPGMPAGQRGLPPRVSAPAAPPPARWSCTAISW